MDDKTEEKIMKNIKQTKKDTTVLVIAHRLKILRRCHRVFEFNNGKIVNILTCDKIKLLG